VGVKLTYGLELEWADVDRTAVLPYGKWSQEDYTIVNSDGHANCPQGKRWLFGGEINTDPTDTIVGQLKQVDAFRELLNPTINYRCNLHVHIGVDPLTLDVAKTLLRFIVRWQELLYPIIEPIPVPNRNDYDDEAFKGAMKRYRRRNVSHQHKLPDSRIAEALEATTLQKFYEAHAPVNKTGQRMWPIAPRPGMNTRALKEHGTVEFRHFPGTANTLEIATALRWCEGFVRCAFDGTSPIDFYYANEPWQFPEFKPYDHTLEMRYQETKYK